VASEAAGLALADQACDVGVPSLDRAVMRFQPFQNGAFKGREVRPVAVPDQPERLHGIPRLAGQKVLQPGEIGGKDDLMRRPQIAQRLQMITCATASSRASARMEAGFRSTVASITCRSIVLTACKVCSGATARLALHGLSSPASIQRAAQIVLILRRQGIEPASNCTVSGVQLAKGRAPAADSIRQTSLVFRSRITTSVGLDIQHDRNGHGRLASADCASVSLSRITSRRAGGPSIKMFPPQVKR
jgi:hypothetical protein